MNIFGWPGKVLVCNWHVEAGDRVGKLACDSGRQNSKIRQMNFPQRLSKLDARDSTYFRHNFAGCSIKNHNLISRSRTLFMEEEPTNFQTFGYINPCHPSENPKFCQNTRRLFPQSSPVRGRRMQYDSG